MTIGPQAQIYSQRRRRRLLRGVPTLDNASAAGRQAVHARLDPWPRKTAASASCMRCPKNPGSAVHSSSCPKANREGLMLPGPQEIALILAMPGRESKPASKLRIRSTPWRSMMATCKASRADKLREPASTLFTRSTSAASIA